jgi:hypothetical protein
VRLGPRALAGVTIAVAQQEGFELRPAAPQVLHGVGARPAEVAHGLVAGGGHMHRGQLTGPVQAGQLARVAPVGLHPVATAARDQRRRHDGAMDFQLGAAAREDEPGRSRFVTDPQFGARMGFLQFGEHPLQSVQIVGDGAIGAGFAAAPFGAGAGDVLRVDIESEEQ